MNKKGGIGEISSFAIVFSLISIIFIFVSVFMYASANDYLFYNMQNLIETMEENNFLPSGTSDRTLTYGNDFKDFNLHLDDLWLISYIIFFASSLILSYKAERQNYFSFLSLLFYGIMLILFVLTIFSTLTNWFNDNILLAIIPTAHLIVPKFTYYLNHIGIFSALQLGLCLLVNMLDFDFAKIIQKKKMEDAVMEDKERL